MSELIGNMRDTDEGRAIAERTLLLKLLMGTLDEGGADLLGHYPITRLAAAVLKDAEILLDLCEEEVNDEKWASAEADLLEKVVALRAARERDQ